MRIPRTVPFVRAVAGVGAADDPALDAAAEMLIALERRHGVSIEPASHARQALDWSDAEELLRPFLEETWLIVPGTWTLAVLADGHAISTGGTRWASLVATWLTEKSPKSRLTFLDFATLNDGDAVIDGYARYVSACRRVIEHAWIVRGAVEMTVDVVRVGSLVTLSSPHQSYAWSVRMVASDGADGTNACLAVTSDLGRALIGARRGDVVETERFGSLAVLEIRRA